MKLLITLVLSAALFIWHTPNTKPPVNNSEAKAAVSKQAQEQVQTAALAKADMQVEKPVTQAPAPQPEPIAQGCEAYRSAISQYAWDTQVAMAIMKAESTCNPHAVGDNYVIGGIHAPSCGLFQVRTLPGRPGCEQLKDPSTNVAWAYKLYQGNGWSPWSVYKTGKYLSYL